MYSLSHHKPLARKSKKIEGNHGCIGSYETRWAAWRLVTGGTKGLGKAMAEGLAEAGASVAVISRHADQAAEVALGITAATGQKAKGYGCDVTVQDQVEALVAQVLADFGQVDILVNNAGIKSRGAIDELTLEQFLEVQAINVTGPWLLCRALAGHFKAATLWPRDQHRLDPIDHRHRQPHALCFEQGRDFADDAGVGVGVGALWHYGELYDAGALCHRDECPHQE